MSRRNLPEAPAARVQGVSCDLTPQALERWDASIHAASSDDNSISVFDPIGYDPWTGDGVTAKRIAGALRAIGEKDVTVNVNSPGGDMFEGLAIYNLLREHKGKVTVKVLGVAASAASVVAMAGDDIQIARAGFLMIHNAWVYATGNRNDLREYADTLEPFDRAMADIYAARAGIELKAAQKMMDAETWIGGQDAVDKGFADSLLPADEVKQDAKAQMPSQIAARRLDVMLARQGLPRSERRKLIQEIKTGTPCAADPGTPSAAEAAFPAEAIADLQSALARFQAAALNA